MRAATLLLSLMTVGLCGCQSLEGYPRPLESREEALSLVRDDIQPAAVNAYASIAAEAQSGSRDQRLTAKRDQIVRARLYAIDVNYDDFVRGLTGQQKTFAIGADLVSAGLTGAATLAKSATTKTHLTTYASAALGVRSTVDKELFYSKTLPAVVTQMDASRKTVLAKIAEGLAQSNAAYPLTAALADLQDYYTAGTLNGALNQISKDAGVKNAAAQQRIVNATTVKYATDAGHKSLFGYWAPNGVINKDHETILLACVPVQNGATATIDDLDRIINDGTPEAAQQRAIVAACVKTRDASFS